MTINGAAVVTFMYEFLKVAPLKHVLEKLVNIYSNEKFINKKFREQFCLNIIIF